MMNDRFNALILASGLSQSKVADHLAKRTGEFCDERQIRAWKTSSGKNSLPCPQWAIDAMVEFEQQAA